MTTIKIFLASSEELKHERLVIAEQVANMNRTLANQDITLRLVKWEYLDSSMGAQHKQEDYNDYLVDCDMCFALFWTRFGMYTEIEFEKSLKELNSKGNIRHLSVLFKESTTKSDELRAFEKKCTEEHPTLCHTFKDDDTLKELFNSEIERFISENTHIDNEKDDEIESKSSIQTVRIFLSIDKTLEQERLELTDLVENLNHSLERRNANILMLAWDNSTNDSKDFKKEISKTDLCLNLYYTYFNNTTQAELESAYQALCEGKNPKKIYVYFKDGDAIPEKLQEFRDSFPTKYGHFYCSFSNIDTLKADFLLQFMEYQSKNLCASKMLEVNNGKVTLDGKEYVDLKNVPFAGNNEEYNLLLKSIKKTKKLLAITDEDDEEYADYAAELQQLNEKLSKMENSLWDTALMITRLSTTKCSERLKRAMDLFTAGDNKGAQAVLNEEEIERDVEHNLHLIQLGEEGKKGLKINIEEYKLKIKTLENEMAEGWLEKIIDLRRRILKMSQIGYGNESTHTAEAYEYLALSICDAGNYHEALEHMKEATAMSERTLGKEHPDTAITYNNIGNIFNKLGDFQSAYDYELKALKIRKIKYGENHPDVASSYNTIGVTYINLGEYTKAQEYFTKAIEICKDLLGEKHIDTSHLYINIGKLNSLLGNYPTALEYYFRALLISQNILGEKHPDIALIYNNIGGAYHELGDFSKAIEFYKKALTNSIIILGEKHPDTAGIYTNIGAIYCDMKDFPKALEYGRKALAIKIMTLGEKNHDTATSYCNIGVVYNKIGDYQSGLKYHHKSLEIRKDIFGDCHVDTADSYFNVGNCLQNLKEYSKALKYHNKALEIRIKLLGAKSRDTASSYTNVGIAYSKLGLYNDAIKYMLKGLETKEELSNNMTLDTANSYYNLGIAYAHANKPSKVIEYSLKALDIYKKELGDNHLLTINSYNSIGYAYGSIADNLKEKGYLNSSLEKFRTALGFFNKTDNQEMIEICALEIRKIENIIK